MTTKLFSKTYEIVEYQASVNYCDALKPDNVRPHIYTKKITEYGIISISASGLELELDYHFQSRDVAEYVVTKLIAQDKENRKLYLSLNQKK